MTTHITKEGLLLAINEGSDDLYRPVLLARAAELSAQESKPEHLELSEVVYAAGDTDDAFIWPVDWGDPVECEGFVILRGDPKLREWIKLMLDHARQNMADAVAFIRSQDASPKDGWQIEIVPDPPYPPIVRVRSPEGVARVLTEGDGVLYRYFHKVALAALEVPK